MQVSHVIKIIYNFILEYATFKCDIKCSNKGLKTRFYLRQTLWVWPSELDDNVGLTIRHLLFHWTVYCALVVHIALPNKSQTSSHTSVPGTFRSQRHPVYSVVIQPCVYRNIKNNIYNTRNEPLPPVVTEWRFILGLSFFFKCKKKIKIHMQIYTKYFCVYLHR